MNEITVITKKNLKQPVGNITEHTKRKINPRLYVTPYSNNNINMNFRTRPSAFIHTDIIQLSNEPHAVHTNARNQFGLGNKYNARVNSRRATEI